MAKLLDGAKVITAKIETTHQGARMSQTTDRWNWCDNSRTAGSSHARLKMNWNAVTIFQKTIGTSFRCNAVQWTLPMRSIAQV